MKETNSLIDEKCGKFGVLRGAAAQEELKRTKKNAKGAQEVGGFSQQNLQVSIYT